MARSRVYRSLPLVPPVHAPRVLFTTLVCHDPMQTAIVRLSVLDVCVGFLRHHTRNGVLRQAAWVIDEAAQNVVRHGIPDEGGEMAAVVVAPYRGQPNVQVVFCWHSIPLGEDDDRRMRRFLDRRVTRSTPGGRGLQYIRALSSRMTLPRLLTSTEQEAVAKAFGFHPAPPVAGWVIWIPTKKRGYDH